MEFCNIQMERFILLKASERTERGEIVALAKSIRKHGLLVPITARKILHTDRYEVISGVKRFYACRLAGLKILPTYVVNVPSSLGRAIIKRWDTQDIFEEAESIRSLILSDNISPEELSDYTGYTQKEILGLLRMTKLGEFEIEIVRRNNIPKEIVSEIAFFDDITRRTELFSKVIHSRLNMQEVKAICERERKGRPLSKENAKKTPKFRDMKLFDNTITRALTLLKESGIKANYKSEQINGATEYKIRIEN